jgi:RHS repeat-associated protein
VGQRLSWTLAEYESSDNWETEDLAREFLWGERFPEPLVLIDWTAAGDVAAESEEVLHYLHDHLGSVIALVDAGDPDAKPEPIPPKVVERYTYDPYGTTYIETWNGSGFDEVEASAYGNPFAWTAQRYDAGVGLYAFPFRGYSPALARFLQRDPLGYIDGPNLYEYVASMPTVATDPLGLTSLIDPNGGMGTPTPSHGMFGGAEPSGGGGGSDHGLGGFPGPCGDPRDISDPIEAFWRLGDRVTDASDIFQVADGGDVAGWGWLGDMSVLGPARRGALWDPYNDTEADVDKWIAGYHKHVHDAKAEIAHAAGMTLIVMDAAGKVLIFVAGTLTPIDELFLAKWGLDKLGYFIKNGQIWKKGLFWNSRASLSSFLDDALRLGACFAAGTLVQTPSGPVAIEDLDVGQRVVSEADASDGFPPLDDLFETLDTDASQVAEAAEHSDLTATAVDPATWRLVSLTMASPEIADGLIEIRLLRPLEWIRGTGAAVGATIPLAIAELGLDDLATVQHIEPCPPIEPGLGAVILGTITHLNAHLLELEFEGAAAPVRATHGHPFYSTDRDEWVAARDLQAGETVRTLTGKTQLLTIRPVGGTYRVYNLEIEGVHQYHVTSASVLAHNGSAKKGNGCAAPKTTVGLGGRALSAAEQAAFDAFAARARALGLIENPHRTGSWGRMVNGKFQEVARIDVAEAGKAGWRGKTHVHIAGQEGHLDPTTKIPGE